MNLKVSLDKSNIIVFGKGGYLAVRERWFCGNDRIELVNAYKYLAGILPRSYDFFFFFYFACSDLAARGKKAVMGILSVLCKFLNQSMTILQKLFDSKVQPVLLYVAEIWGLEDDYCYQVEKTRLFALKRFLGVSQRTPNSMIYGDTARYPLYINAVSYTHLTLPTRRTV